MHKKFLRTLVVLGIFVFCAFSADKARAMNEDEPHEELKKAISLIKPHYEIDPFSGEKFHKSFFWGQLGVEISNCEKGKKHDSNVAFTHDRVKNECVACNYLLYIGKELFKTFLLKDQIELKEKKNDPSLKKCARFIP